MDYDDLEEYAGEKICCDNCGREFTEGELITVDDNSHAFCYTGPKGGCLIAYVFSIGEVYCGNVQTMRFRGSKWRIPENPIPNYPNMPISRKKEEQNKWLRKIIDSLGLGRD